MITIHGRPVTKKNSGRIVKAGRFMRILPSKAYEAYEEDALMQIRMQRPKAHTGEVLVTCRYWMRDRRSWPDLVGLLQATSDILETAGVIENDRYIVSYDGSRIMGVDKDNPRAEIEIRERRAEDGGCEA